MASVSSVRPVSSTQERALSELRHLILVTQREGNRWLGDALRPIGLTPSQAEILTVLAERDKLTLVELGRSIVCETGSPSRLVDHLVRRGLVERQPGTTDRRVVHLQFCTESGQELAGALGRRPRRCSTILPGLQPPKTSNKRCSLRACDSSSMAAGKARSCSVASRMSRRPTSPSDARRSPGLEAVWRCPSASADDDLRVVGDRVERAICPYSAYGPG